MLGTVSLPGVNVVGPFEAELGNGETARMLVAALDAAGVPCLPIGFVASASRQGHAFPHATDPEALFPVSILCVNADQTPRFHARLGERFFAGRRTIGVWWWETTLLPPWLAESFAYVDEVWAGSAFVAEALRPAAGSTPVHQVDLPVRWPDAPALPRDALGLPDDRPVVLFSFDHNSVLDRKNPQGAIEAFRRAFPVPGPDGPVLLVKSINGDRHPAAHDRVLQAAAGHPDVIVRDGYLDAADRDGLVAACDVYLSLHRAEGFGLTLAEALALGKPVIATGWSGSTEVLDEASGFPVRFVPRPVGPEQGPYPAEGVWAEPDLEHAAALLRDVLGDLSRARAHAAAGRERVRTRFSAEACAGPLAQRVRRATPWQARVLPDREVRTAREIAAGLRARRA
ncbi:MAG TPA: glycosyltransferase [Baekduia sp.]|nr:glycosyltransferase [Baekduia sp.]